MNPAWAQSIFETTVLASVLDTQILMLSMFEIHSLLDVHQMADVTPLISFILQPPSYPKVRVLPLNMG